MNFSKSLILTSALIGFAGVSSAVTIIPAPSIPTTSIFSVSGEFENGAVLGGSFDVTNGQITNAEMNISGIKGNFTLDQGGHYDNGVWENVQLTDGNYDLTLDLVYPNGNNSLQDYKGGALCSSSTSCQGIVSSYQTDADPLLAKGTVAATPEPGSILLFGVGLSAAGCVFRRRTVKN